jgi:tetratricopeptide (TPR) repeat protein
MPDNSRIEDLRRRVQNDPASIAFAQLAEEYRRARQYQESVRTCQTGLKIHPRFLSARITLGRALIELGRIDEACEELTLVLKSEPRNLSAIRALADAHRRRGAWSEALQQYRAALELAGNDPDLARAVSELTAQTGGPVPTPSMTPSTHSASTSERPISEPRSRDRSSPLERPVVERPVERPPVERGQMERPPAQPLERSVLERAAAERSLPERPAVERVPVDTPPVDRPGSDAVASSSAPKLPERESRVLASLEQWLTAIHVSRAQRRP